MEAQAIAMLEVALDARQAHAPENELEIAVARDLLGGLVARAGDLERAIQLYEEALATRVELLGPEHLDVAASLEHLGAAVGNRGDYGRAAELHRQAFEIRERLLGPDDPQLVTSLHNLAVPLRAQGHFREAEQDLLRAARIVESHLGPVHFDTARSYEQLAGLYEQMRDYARALDYQERALRVQRQLYREGPHPVVASTLMSLAIVKAELGQRFEAQRLRDEAMRMYEQTGSLDRYYERYKMARYAAVTGDKEAALSHLRQACVERGYSSAARLLADPALEALRGDPGFEEVLAAVRRRTGEP
jgi:tetratricopeptide (TPR) repeat protein